MKKGLLTIFAAAALALTPLASVSAETDIAQTTAISAEELPDNRELEAMYLEKLFYGDGIAAFADYGYNLPESSKKIYQTLREHIEKVAAGELTSTVVTMPVSGYADGNALADDVKKAVKHLLADLPEDFYWFDKTKDLSIEYSTQNGVIVNCTISFRVAESYAGDKEFTVNSDKIEAAKTAVETAQEIAAKYDGLTDYEKIMGYVDEICGLVEYNYSAITTDTPYGDPWQLVYVFDGNPDTNVVCEGYSKAFQYLCDLGGVDCYTVTGIMGGGTGEGAHMWNIVRLGEISYLVDVTNCDGNSIGTSAPDGKGLILKGAATSSATGCYFKLNDLNEVTYTYDKNTVNMYPARLLEVSTVDYEPLPPVCKHEFDGWESDENNHWQICKIENCGEKIGEAAHVKDGGTVTIAPTADTEGVRTFKCVVCGAELGTEAIPALGDTHEHDYAITNSDENEHWKECVCGEIDETTGQKHKTATREDVVIEPTCAVEGMKYVIAYCSDCGRELERTTAAVEKTKNHTESEKYSFSPAGHWKVCTVCGEKITTTQAHISDKGTLTTPPTETEKGVMTYKCSDCGYIMRTEEVDTVGHKPAEEWTSDEKGHWHECANCDEKLEFAAHTPNEGIVTVPATETTPGKRVYKCTICEYVIRTETIPMLGHVHTPAEKWDADATGHWHDCAGCEERLFFAAHTSDKGTVTTPATPATTGVKTYKCTVCGYIIRTEEIPVTEPDRPEQPDKPGHTHTPAEAWSYNAEGHWHACAGCDEKLGYQAHSLTDGVCSVCGYSNIVDPKVSIVIDPASLTMHAGDTRTITASASKGGIKIEDAVFTWKSDKETVVKINSKGEATAVGKGTAVVSAEYAGIKASCTITVEARPVVTLSPTSLQLRKNAEYTLKVKVTLDGKAVDKPNVVWNSSNTDIATVSGGVITGIKAGTATITAEYDGVKAVCSVTVRTSGSTSAVTRPTRPYRPSTSTNYDDEDDDKDDKTDTPEVKPANKATLNGKAAEWSDIAKDISSGSGSCKLELNGEKEVPSEVVTAISNSRRTVDVVVDRSVTLKLNGEMVNSTLPVAFAKTEVKPDGLRGTGGLGFSYIGAANTGISAIFDRSNSGKFANMYLKSGNTYTFVENTKISSAGSAELNIPGGGVYVIMISDFSDLKGDADNNGTINALDAAAILKNAVQGKNPANRLAADYDGNGTVNALDAAFILKKITQMQ